MFSTEPEHSEPDPSHDYAAKEITELEHQVMYWREIAESESWPFEWQVASDLQKEIGKLRAAILKDDGNARNLEIARAAMQAGIRLEAERHDDLAAVLRRIIASADECDVTEGAGVPMVLIDARLIEEARESLK